LNNWSVIDCRLDNLSATGAKLTIYNPMPIPDEFRIRLATGMEVVAEKVWQHGLSIGVRFTSPPAPPPAKMSKAVGR
jgi:hypothetical protein